jgi:hypothetical protein
LKNYPFLAISRIELAPQIILNPVALGGEKTAIVTELKYAMTNIA